MAILAVSCAAANSYAGNPLVKDAGMADPHVRIFNDKAYLYSTIDAEPNSPEWNMPAWAVWSSNDLIEWKLERTIKPVETYIGESTYCWAPDAEQRNGKTYFYFSNHNKDTGVMVSDMPQGPFKDALGKPLMSADLTPSKEYDISILTDNDKNKTPYIAFGHHRDAESHLRYYVAKLADTMIALAEEPKKIEITGGFGGNDKPNLHKYKDTYYLTAGAKFATSKNIYGPYVYHGYSGGNDQPFGLSNQAHGNYFTWNNQWFHVWCQFIWDKEKSKFRDSKMTYLHYKDNGEMVDDVGFLEKHYATGVGQYDAAWEKIEAEWYMKASNLEKRESASGFELRNIHKDSSVTYPNVRNAIADTTISFQYASKEGAVIVVRANDKKGAVLAQCTLPKTGEEYAQESCQLKNNAGDLNLFFEFKGKSKDLVRLDWFRLNAHQ